MADGGRERRERPGGGDQPLGEGLGRLRCSRRGQDPLDRPIPGQNEVHRKASWRKSRRFRRRLPDQLGPDRLEIDRKDQSGGGVVQHPFGGDHPRFRSALWKDGPGARAGRLGSVTRKTFGREFLLGFAVILWKRRRLDLHRDLSCGRPLWNRWNGPAVTRSPPCPSADKSRVDQERDRCGGGQVPVLRHVSALIVGRAVRPGPVVIGPHRSSKQYHSSGASAIILSKRAASSCWSMGTASAFPGGAGSSRPKNFRSGRPPPAAPSRSAAPTTGEPAQTASRAAPCGKSVDRPKNSVRMPGAPNRRSATIPSAPPDLRTERQRNAPPEAGNVRRPARSR